MAPFESGSRHVNDESWALSAVQQPASAAEIARMLMAHVESEVPSSDSDWLELEADDPVCMEDMEVDWRSGFDTVTVCRLPAGALGITAGLDTPDLLALDMTYYYGSAGLTLYRVRTAETGIAFAFYAPDTANDDEYYEVAAEGLVAYMGASPDELAASEMLQLRVYECQSRALGGDAGMSGGNLRGADIEYR